MRILRYGAALAAGMLMLAASAAQATVTVHETLFTVGDSQGSQGGVQLSSGSISGTFGTKTFSNQSQVLEFSTLTVDSSDQGQNLSYDFSYNCESLTPHCGHPIVQSQADGAAADDFVTFTLNTSELPGAAFPTLGHPTSVSGNIDFGIDDFVFISTGKVFVTETFSVFDGAPEPADWALMLMGFGGLGVVLRHRRTPITA
jgi:hypothetical protein